MTQIVMTPDQLDGLVSSIVAKVSELNRATAPQPEAQPQSPKRYVYGLRGIRELFNVSHVTAQRYKDTFLAPAVLQRGRKIVVDADMAVELFNNFRNADGNA